VVEGRGEIAGIPIAYQDTAGLRPEPGRVERQGIERSRAAAQSADLLLIAIDGAEREVDPRPGLLELLGSGAPPAVVAINKRDLDAWSDRLPAELERLPAVAVSALTGQGLNELQSAIGTALNAGPAEHEPLLVNARQHAAVATALEHTRRSAAVLRENRGVELAAVDLRAARDALAGLWGRDATAEVIDAIFSTFCLGK
jgi:tRNA modification GTPase